MVNVKYISEVLSQKWKTTDCRLVSKVSWDDDMEGFTFDIDGDEFSTFTNYDDFFKLCVIRSNERFWDSNSVTQDHKKYLCGWLCVMNAMAIFNKFEGLETTKETAVITKYVNERLDDAYYSMENNLLPPWMGEKVDMNFI